MRRQTQTASRAFLLIAVFFALVFSVSEVSTNKVTISTNLLTEIIAINSTESLHSILPAHEYFFPINVAWNVPDSSLQNINSENVTVFVRATVEEGHDYVYFKDGSRRTNASYLILVCKLYRSMENGALACSQDSQLSKSLYVYIYSNQSSLHEINSTILFSAGFSPFEDFVPIYQKSISLQNQLDELKTKLNVSDPEVIRAINETQEAINSFHIEHAESSIKNLSMKTGDFMFSLSIFISQIFSQISALFDFLMPDSNYFVPIALSLIVIVYATLAKLRRLSKYGILLVAILVATLAFFRSLSPSILIAIDVVLILLITSILYARRESKGKKRFRASDDYLEPDYEELIKRRNR